MFDLIKINIENFRSYKGKHSFKFPNEPGLYSFAGQNLTEPDVSPNGAGKSTFIDCVFWCLYGKTTRGLRAGDVRTWGIATKARCQVRIWLSVADSKLVVTRTQSPNSLKVSVDGEKARVASQEELDSLIRIGPEAFLHSVITPQFGDMFFDLKPASKLSLFSEIMELNLWLQKSDEAKDIAKDIESDIGKKELQVSNLKGKLSIIDKTIERTNGLIEEFEEEKLVRLDKIRNDIKEAKNRSKKDSQDFLSTKEDRDVYAKLDADIKEEKNELTIEISGFNREKIQLDLDIKGMRGNIDVHNQNISRLRNMKGKCPTCLQSINKEHLRKENDRVKDEIAEIESQIAGVKRKIEDIDILMEAKQSKYNKLCSEHESITKKYRVVQDRYQALKIKQETSSDTVRKLGITLAEEKRKKNPHVKILSECEKDYEQTQSKIEVLEEAINEETDYHEEVMYWVNGFKRVRLYVIEETLKQLEVEVNNNLISLGLLDWAIEFDVEKDNKSGGVTTGFSVFIYSPYNEEPVRWEAWSGGETQRLKLAGTLGLSHLIADRAGVQFRMEYFDEPTAHLSEGGIEDLMSTLHQRAIDTDSKVWLVDHRSLDFGGFSGILKAIKDDEGSHLEYINLGDGE